MNEDKIKEILRKCKVYIEPEADMWTDTKELLDEINETLEEE